MIYIGSRVKPIIHYDRIIEYSSQGSGLKEDLSEEGNNEEAMRKRSEGLWLST